MEASSLTVAAHLALEVLDLSKRRVLSACSEEVAQVGQGDAAVAALVEEGEGLLEVGALRLVIRHDWLVSGGMGLFRVAAKMRVRALGLVRGEFVMCAAVNAAEEKEGVDVDKRGDLGLDGPLFVLWLHGRKGRCCRVWCFVYVPFLPMCAEESEVRLCFV